MIIVSHCVLFRFLNDSLIISCWNQCIFSFYCLSIQQHKTLGNNKFFEFVSHFSCYSKGRRMKKILGNEWNITWFWYRCLGISILPNALFCLKNNHFFSKNVFIILRIIEKHEKLNPDIFHNNFPIFSQRKTKGRTRRIK